MKRKLTRKNLRANFSIFPHHIHASIYINRHSIEANTRNMEYYVNIVECCRTSLLIDTESFEFVPVNAETSINQLSTREAELRKE